MVNELIRPSVVAGIAEAESATLRFAVDEARRFHMDLEVVHCAGFIHHAAQVVDQIRFEDWHEAAERVLGDARTSISREFDPPKSRFRMSDHAPVDELLQVATEAAEIVVGSDNPSWFARMLGPGVSQIVGRAAICPVVVVPEYGLESSRMGRIVVGLEGSRPEEHVLRYAFEHANRRGCELLVIHALPSDAWAGEIEAHQAAIAEALAGWNEKYPDITVTRRFVEGVPSRVLARATLNAELVVVGQPGPSLAPFALDRPTAHALLKQAGCPIAIVPDALS
jgi:nucleotide-binding universal stress UspA family protein